MQERVKHETYKKMKAEKPSHGPRKQYKKRGGQHSQEIDSSEEGEKEEEEERLLLDDWDD